MTPNIRTIKALPSQVESLSATVGGSVTEEEKGEIVKALSHYGWAQSSGVRTVMVAFVRSVAVRDAVLDFLHKRAA